MLTVTALKPSVPKRLPPPNGDFQHFAQTLSADELATLKQVSAFMAAKVAPLELSRPRPWTRPTLGEICIGLEINGYLPAEF